MTDSHSNWLQKSSQIRQIDDCFWIFFFNNFISIESCFLKFRWCYDQCFFEICIVDIMIYCFVLDVDFHTNDLIESNCCIINVFCETFRRFCFDLIMKSRFRFFFTFFLWNSVDFFSVEIKKRNLSIDYCLIFDKNKWFEFIVRFAFHAKSYSRYRILVRIRQRFCFDYK